MNIELEAKIKVPDLACYRERLEQLSAELADKQDQEDTFFDRPDRIMVSGDRGLRLREMVGLKKSYSLLCFKGPRQSGNLKLRQEIEFGVDDSDKARAFLAALGFNPFLIVKKHRELWKHGGCEVCLDTVERLGTFIEIEGPDAETVRQVLHDLKMEKLPTITDSYAALLAKL